MSKAIKFRNKNNELIYPCPYYPVGSIYISINNINPSVYFGGIWEQIKDKFLLCAGNTYPAGSTGGQASVTLSTDQIPKHNHPVMQRRHSPTPFSSFYNDNYSNGQAEYCFTQSAKMVNTGSTDNLFTTDIGGGKSHNNMPPYLAVYVWKRVS